MYCCFVTVVMDHRNSDTHSIAFITADKESKKDKRVKPRLNSLMLRCFISEFCVRWTTNAYDSRYGIYLRDKFDVKSGVYSYVIE